MTDTTSTIRDLSVFLGGLNGLQGLLQGSEMQASGSELEAQYLRDANKFNVSIGRINLSRNIVAQSEQVRRNLATVRAEAGGRGFATGSRTFMAFASDQLTQYERAVRHQITAQQRAEDAATYEAESKARLAEAQAAERRYLAQKKAASALPNLAGQLFNLLGDGE